MFCSNCGKEVEEHAVFCPACGATVEPEGSVEATNNSQAATQPMQQAATQPAQQQAPQGSFCAGCGTFIEAGVQFCPKCGTAKGGVKKLNVDEEKVQLAKTMLKTPVDGFAALYQDKDAKLPMIFVAVQVVLAVIYGLLLNNRLVSAYNDYVSDLATNLTKSLTSMFSGILGGAGGLVNGIGTAAVNELIGELFGGSTTTATLGTTLQLKSDLIGFGAIILTSILAIAAQIVLLFLLMQIFKIKSVFRDAVKVYAAKSFWSAICIFVAVILVFISPVVSVGVVLISGILINHSVGQMLEIHSPGSRNQIFWIQLIFSIIELATIAVCVKYIGGSVGENLVSYLGTLIGSVGGILSAF